MTASPAVSDPRTGAAPPVVQARGLRKHYGRTEALRGIDLELPGGSMTLLAGPNGAGKTTLLRLLLDTLPRSGGELAVLGWDPAREGARVRAGIGFLGERGGFPFDHLRVREYLDLQARFRPRWDPDYAARLARALDLKSAQRWKTLSKGEARRAQVVAALAHRPPLLLLDEPTDGLDPVARETVLGLLAEHLAETGATMLYCTHVLHEVQGLPDRLVVLRKGEVRLHEEVETLHRTLFRVRLAGDPANGQAPARPAHVVREEVRGPGGRRWVMRGTREELQAWAASQSVELAEVTPLPLADAALAYLSTEEDAA
jgi:ABC-2 type transport system ATP-binding protein